MTMLSMCTAAGVWPGLPATGYLLFARRQRSAFPAVTFGAVLAVAGIAVWSLPLLAAAVAGVYRPEYFGLVGWLVAAAALVKLSQSNALSDARAGWKTTPTAPRTAAPPPENPSKRSRKDGPSSRKPQKAHTPQGQRESAAPHPTPTWDAGAIWNGVLAVGLLLAAVLYLAFPSESIYGGRDEGVYSTHAVYMAHHGKLDVPYPWPADAAAMFSDVWVGFPGYYKTANTMTPQFGHLFPVWLAQAFASLGAGGLFHLNALFTWLAVAVFYGLCRMVLPQPAAVVAALFFALNPGELWMARITLSEMLTQLFVWSGLLLLLQALKDGQTATARWAGACLGLSAFVRFDSLLLMPLLVLGHAAQAVTAPEPESADAAGRPSVWAALYQTAVPTFALAFAYFWIFSAPYLAERPYLGKLAAALTVSVVILGIALTSAAKIVRPLISSTAFLIALGIALSAVAAYAYWIRPLAAGPAQLQYRWPGYSLDVTHDYSRNTFRDLAQYLSPPVTWAALGGWFVTLWKRLRHGGNHYFIVALVLIAASSVVYMQTTFNTADHLWAVRRFIPIIIPGFIVCAALGMQWGLEQLPARGTPAAAGVLLALLAAFTLWSDRLIAVTADDPGYYAQIQRLAEQLPRDQLVLARGFTEFLTPLYIAFDRRIVPLNLDPGSKGHDALHAWVARQSGAHQPAYLLLEGQTDLRGLRARPLYETDITRAYIEPTVNPLPTKTISRQRHVQLYEITQ
ncbi:MAG TPA: hypothetical protein VN812_03390 [Candidatus Acidoferrales bacterium]|nr:hypothetical protein [Candidatus Acidoferrales bacterium]